MRITRLVLSDFGKFHQQEIVLSAGLNIATGSNEAGKTTLRRFIRSMFYGLERERGIKARTDDYSRLKPWDSGRFQGILEFEAEGKIYRIFRNFLTYEKEMILTDLSTGRNMEHPAEFLQSLGLTSEAVYTNTFWIGNACMTEELLAEELKDYLANLAYSGGTGLNLQKSLGWLNTKKKAILKQIPEEEIARCREQMFTKEDIANRKAEAEASLEGLLQSRRELDRKIGLHKNRTEELRAGLEMAEKEEKIIGKKLHGCTVIGVVSLATLSASAVIDRWQIPFFIGTAFVIACIILVYRLWKQRSRNLTTLPREKITRVL